MFSVHVIFKIFTDLFFYFLNRFLPARLLKALNLKPNVFVHFHKKLKTYSKRIWKSCSQCFVMKNYWYDFWFSYTFYLHMGLLIFSNNFGKILFMSWINQAFILGHNTWVRRITKKTSLISTVFTEQVEKNNQEIISKRCMSTQNDLLIISH